LPSLARSKGFGCSPSSGMLKNGPHDASVSEPSHLKAREIWSQLALCPSQVSYQRKTARTGRGTRARSKKRRSVSLPPTSNAKCPKFCLSPERICNPPLHKESMRIIFSSQILTAYLLSLGASPRLHRFFTAKQNHMFS